jgi:hypothetical protein
VVRNTVSRVSVYDVNVSGLRAGNAVRRGAGLEDLISLDVLVIFFQSHNHFKGKFLQGNV